MEDDGPLPLLAFAFLGPSAPLLWQMQAEGLLLPDPCVPKKRISHNFSFSRSRLEAMLDHVEPWASDQYARGSTKCLQSARLFAGLGYQMWHPNSQHKCNPNPKPMNCCLPCRLPSRRSLTREELLELNKQPDQRPA